MIFTLVLTSLTASSQAPPGNQETILTFVHDVLLVFYPRTLVKGNQLILCVSHPADSSWREISGIYFKVVPFSKDEPSPLEENKTAALLQGSFWLTPSKKFARIFQISVSLGPYETQLSALRAMVQSHPEWSESQAIQALKEAGARYGPGEKQEFVNSLHLENMEKFLGKLKIQSVDFSVAAPSHNASLARPSFEWIVLGESRVPDGTNEIYLFAFEPFSGSLTYLSRR